MSLSAFPIVLLVSTGIFLLSFLPSFLFSFFLSSFHFIEVQSICNAVPISVIEQSESVICMPFSYSFSVWFIIGYWIQFPELYSQTFLFIHSKHSSLHLIISNFQSIPLLPCSLLYKYREEQAQNKWRKVIQLVKDYIIIRGLGRIWVQPTTTIQCLIYGSLFLQAQKDHIRS